MQQQRAQKHAEQPARADDAVPCEAQRGAQRRGEPGTHVVLAVSRHLHVDGQDERVVAGARDALDQLHDACVVARKIGLKPGGRARFTDALQRRQRSAAEDHRYVGRRRATREHQVALVGGHRGPAHRRDAERRSVRAPEKRRLVRAPRRIHQSPGNERDLVPYRAVRTQRCVRLHAAGNVAENRARNDATRGALEIVQRQDAPQDARRRHIEAGAGGGRGDGLWGNGGRV